MLLIISEIAASERTRIFVLARCIASDEGLWKNLCVLHYNVSYHASPESWLELYR